MPMEAARGVAIAEENPQSQAWDPEPEKRPDWNIIISELTTAEAEQSAAKSSGVGGFLRRSIAA